MQDRRRSTMVKVGAWGAGIVALVAVVAAAEDDPDYAAVCADEATQTRVDDEQCDDGGGGRAGFYGGRGWYYVPRGSHVPAVGAPVGGGSMSLPASGKSYSAGFDPGGGVVSRGGFGHGSSSFGG